MVLTYQLIDNRLEVIYLTISYFYIDNECAGRHVEYRMLW